MYVQIAMQHPRVPERLANTVAILTKKVSKCTLMNNNLVRPAYVSQASMVCNYNPVMSVFHLKVVPYWSCKDPYYGV